MSNTRIAHRNENRGALANDYPDSKYELGLAQPSADQRSADSSRWWWVLVGLGLILTIVSRLIIRQSAIAPRTPWDEISMLQMGRVIAGYPDVTPLAGSGYYPGYSFILAPAWWFSSDPATVYQIATFIGFGLSLLTILPLACIARRLRLGVPQALVAATIVMSLPSRTALADYVLSEEAFFFFLCWTVAAAFWLWDRPSVLRALGFAALASLTYLMHVRALVVLLVAGIWLVLFLRRQVAAALAGLAGLGAGYFGVKAVVKVITEPMTLWGFSQGSNFADDLRNVFPSLLVRVTTAHLWAQLVATFGLVIIGAIMVITWCISELRDMRAVGPVGLIFGLVSAGTLLGILPWLGLEVMLYAGNRRFDAWQYTRYIDPYAGLLVLLAAIALLRVMRGRWLLAALGIGIIGSLAMIFVAAPIIPTWGRNDGPGNAAGVQMWSWIWPKERFEVPLIPTPVNANRYYFWASVVVLLCLLAYYLLRRHTRALALLMLVLATTGAIVGNPEHRRAYPTNIERGVTTAEAAAGHQLTVDVDTQCGDSGSNRAMALNWTAYWLSPRDVDAIEPDYGDPFDSELVVACRNWARANILHAQAIPDTADYGYQVYVLPGPVRDELAARGQLGPAR